MRNVILFLLLVLIPASIYSQIEEETSEESLSGGIPSEELPLAVVWGLSAYSGATIPFSPDAFSEFWKPGFNLTVDMDILLRNDIVLGLSFSYSHLKFDTQEFWRRRGVQSNGDLSSDFDIPISNLLLSYRGRENYLLPSYEAIYEVGGGFYHIQNTDLDKVYFSDYDYFLQARDQIEVGLFGGLGIAWLLNETLQLRVKGRYHYVYKRSQRHQYFDLMLRLSLL